MEASAISDVVRMFNRTVTVRVGALSDHYLSGDRPLGAARVLWEIGEEGCELRALRSRLALDSSYLSRLLRSLEGAGLITVVPSEADMRYRRAKLTPEGRDERALLDKRSDELAQSMFQPLTDATPSSQAIPLRSREGQASSQSWTTRRDRGGVLVRD
jgi:DNA-binding MarR family transcriptional regulator